MEDLEDTVVSKLTFAAQALDAEYLERPSNDEGTVDM